jgi:hypothetical protein
VIFGLDGLALIATRVFLAWTIVAVWIVFYGGAEWLEDTWLGEVLLWFLFNVTFTSPAAVVRGFVALAWAVCLFLLVFLRLW